MHTETNQRALDRISELVAAKPATRPSTQLGRVTCVGTVLDGGVGESRVPREARWCSVLSVYNGDVIVTGARSAETVETSRHCSRAWEFLFYKRNDVKECLGRERKMLTVAKAARVIANSGRRQVVLT